LLLLSLSVPVFASGIIIFPIVYFRNIN